MTRITLKTVLLISIPLTAVLALVIGLALRDDGAARDLRLRQRAELDRTIEEERAARGGNPAASLRAFRAAQSPGATPTVDPKASRQELLKLGDRGIPVIKTAIYDAKELPLVRLELVGVLADIKTPASDTVVLEILADKGLEERFRAVALAKLAGRPLDSALPVLKRIFEEEPIFSNRSLLIKAIGETKHPDTLPLLMNALTRETTSSARIQVVDSLATRTEVPAVIEGLQRSLREDPEENVRLAALAGIARTPGRSADEVLAQILENPQSSAPLKQAAASWIEKRKRD